MRKNIYVAMLILITISATAQDLSKEITKTLELFKTGYEQRDTSKVNKWFDTIFYDNVEVIGTFAIDPSKKEWKNTKSESIAIFKSDWIRWGDLNIDLSKANIDYDNNLAWVSFPAIITRNPNNSSTRTAKESFSGMLKNIANISTQKDSEMNEELKLHLIAYYSNLVMYQYAKGEEYIWPMRISGVLQKENNKWKFRQIHFSYPNRGFPNVRY